MIKTKQKQIILELNPNHIALEVIKVDTGSVLNNLTATAKQKEESGYFLEYTVIGCGCNVNNHASNKELTIKPGQRVTLLQTSGVIDNDILHNNVNVITAFKLDNSESEVIPKLYTLITKPEIAAILDSIEYKKIEQTYGKDAISRVIE